MPLWILKLLPYAAGIAGLIAAVVYINHEGYKRAEAHYEKEKADADLRQAKADKREEKFSRDLEQKIQLALNANDEKLSNRIGSINTVEKTIVQPTLIKEIHREARFSDSTVGITDGMRQAINSARSTSDPACTAATNRPATCSVSDTTIPH